MRWLKWIWLLLLWPAIGHAATYNAATCSESDVQAAYTTEQASKADGDIIAIPSCSGGTAWTSSWTITPTNSLTFSGNTTVTGNCAPTSTTCTVVDNTVIIDNVSRAGGDLPLLQINTASGKAYRVTGITLKTNGSSSQSFNGAIVLAGSSTSVRLDHMNWDMVLHGKQARVIGCVYGVMDHSNVVLTAASTNNFIFTDQGGCGGDASGVGNGQWNESTNLGGSTYFYFENNDFTGGTNTAGSGATVVPFIDDCSGGGRFVFRFNLINGAEAQGHATGHSDNPPDRSCRAYEIYENAYGNSTVTTTTDPAEAAFFNTGGTGVMWGNTFPGNYKNMIEEVEDRMNASTYTQTATPSGWGYCASSAVGGVAGPSNWDQNTSGQSGWRCLDQVGVGQGDLLQGSFPNVCDATSSDCTNNIFTGRWPNQASEPFYEWLNAWHTPSGWAGVIFSGDGVVTLANRDYYKYALAWNGSSFTGTAFNGTTGTGSGTLAARPSTCTTGVAYWATDQGSWNSSGNGTGNGVLYKCSSTNTWTTLYTPYAYPHPLVSGAGSTPTFSPVAGTYTGTQTVAISTTAGGVICYNTTGSPATNGTTGCTTGTLYTTAVSVTSSETLFAVAGGTGFSDSAVGSAAYTINSTAATPTFSPVTGTYASTQTVTISTTSGTVICYNTTGSPATNGTTGCATGTLYSGTVSVSSSETLYAVAGGTGLTDSSIGSAAYVIRTSAATPTFSPVAGTYSGSQTVTISTTTGTTICYNTTGSPATNGTTGCTTGTLYTGPISVTSSKTVYAVAGGSIYNDSSVGSAAYVINTGVTPTAIVIGAAHLIGKSSLGNVPAGLSLNPGWQYIQAWLYPTQCSGTSCDDQQILPTTAGSVWLAVATGQSTSTVHIASVSTTGGTATWTHCVACALWDSGTHFFSDIFYSLNGSAGVSEINATLSASPSVFGQIEFVELLPPTGYTASFDSGNAESNTTCTVTCPGASLTVSGTDVLFQSSGLQTDGSYASFSGVSAGGSGPWVGGAGYGYETLLTGDGLCLNCTVGTAPNASIVPSSGTGNLQSAIAFTSSAGTFTTPSPVFTVANINAYLSGTHTNSYNCSPTCSYTLNSTTSGNLLFMEVSNEVNADYISSISGGGTWVIPTQCQQTATDGSNLTLSCAYVLSATGSTTSISITMSGSSSDVGIVVYEIHKSSGSFALDTIGAGTNANSFVPNGQALTISGVPDVEFQAVANNGAVGQGSYYRPYFIGGTNGPAQYGNEFLWTDSTSTVLLNAYSAVTPVWLNPQNNQTIVNGVSFK